MATVENQARVFAALGDKTRLNLFQSLNKQPEICVGQLAEKLNISSACVSQHMKILMEAKLVNRIRNGQKVCYQVDQTSDFNKVFKQIIFK